MLNGIHFHLASNFYDHIMHFYLKKFAVLDFVCIFAAIESATLPVEQRTRAGLLLYMSTLRIYTKQALSIANQLELLKSRGLLIADESKAAKFLGEVSYFRFIQYLRPMEVNKTTHQFKTNSRFADAVGLYEFDTELRDLVFKAVQRLEIALRTKIIHEFSAHPIKSVARLTKISMIRGRKRTVCPLHHAVDF